MINKLLFYLGGSVLIASVANSAVISLTPGAPTGNVGGAQFTLVDLGTGTINPSLVRLDVGGSGVEMGHNYSDTAVVPGNDENSQGHSDIRLSAIPVVSSGAASPAFQFFVDANESGGDKEFNLDRLLVFTSSTGDRSYTATGGQHPSDGDLGVLRYDSGGTTANPSVEVLGTHSNLQKDNQGDLEIRLPLSLFGGANSSDFMYVFAQFSDVDAGDEEFTVVTGLPDQTFLLDGNPVPEPTAPLLLLFSAGGVLLHRRR